MLERVFGNSKWYAALLSYGLVIAVLGAGFLVGRRSAPVREKVVEVSKTDTRALEAQVASMRQEFQAALKQIAEATQRKNVVTTRKTTKAPDGSSTTEVRTEDRSETTTKTETTASASGTSTSEVKLWKETVVHTETVKLVEKLREPDFGRWSGLVLASWDARAPRLEPLLLGQVSYSLVGPLFVSAYVSLPPWALRLTTGGVAVGLVFR